MNLRVKVLDEDLPSLRYSNLNDAGLDLYAREQRLIEPLGRAIVPTGIAVEIPIGYVGLICPRSGLAANKGITVLNAPGVVDSGYRGELQVILASQVKDASYLVTRGNRIAQLVICPVVSAVVEVVEDLSPSPRGLSGLGESGR
jgi:dUTP pyrophosphatase